MKNKAAGALAIGALALTFTGCASISMPWDEPDMTLADSCVYKTIQDNANEAAKNGVKNFVVTRGDMQKIKDNCDRQDKGEFVRYGRIHKERMSLD